MITALHARALNDEIAHARTLIAQRQHERAMPHLERAHVLGQRLTGSHALVHWLMFRAECGRGRWRAAVGQLIRIGMGIVGNTLGVLPVGNTGSSDVNMFRRMPIPSELARLMEGGQS